MTNFTTGIPPIFGQVGSDTDIGGGRENQDDYFVFSDNGVIVLCVLDGHGREVGKIAANHARAHLINFFKQHSATLAENNDDRLIYDCVVTAHTEAHFAIKAAFRAQLEQHFEVTEAPEGYLMKRRRGDMNWSCVHGGSSCSIIVIVHNKLYIANVGDSSGILCGAKKGYQQSIVLPLGDSAKGGMKSSINTVFGVGAAGSGMTGTGAVLGGVGPAELIDTVILTAEHSPECPDEYKRLRDFRCQDDDSRYPALKVVYDSPTSDKTCCPSVFKLDSNNNNEPIVTNDGRYYKNVRKEWASLVSTPWKATFQDALAFTRSLGDLHLHTYGVTHLPEVQIVDLNLIFNSQKSIAISQSQEGGNSTNNSNNNNNNNNNNNSNDLSLADNIFCIVLATDGVWDNWVYEDVTRFVMDSSCIEAVGQAPDGAQRVAQSFMQRNTAYAKRNFGDQADNATGIVAYFSQQQVFTPQIINSV